MSSDFIPHMVYKWTVSDDYNLKGYMMWSLSRNAQINLASRSTITQ